MLPKNRDQVTMLNNAISRLETLLKLTAAGSVISWVEFKQLLEYLKEFFPLLYDEIFPGKSIGAAVNSDAQTIGCFLTSCHAVLNSIWREREDSEPIDPF